MAVGAGQAARVAQALHPPWRLEPAALVMKSPIDSTVPDCISPKAQRWLSGRSFEETTKNGSQLGARFGTIACEPGWVSSLRVRFVGWGAVGSEFSFPLELGRRAARRLLPRGRGGLAQAALATSVLLPQLLIDAAWVLLLRTARAWQVVGVTAGTLPVPSSHAVQNPGERMNLLPTERGLRSVEYLRAAASAWDCRRSRVPWKGTSRWPFC